MRHLAPVACVILTVACSDVGPSGSVAGDLAAHRRDWVALGITSYSYSLRQICFCTIRPNDVVIQVHDRQIIGVRDSQTGETIDVLKWGFYYTIDGLFDMLQEELNRGADKMEARYHPTLFYPLEVTLDRIANAADDELYLTTGELIR